MNSSVIGAKHNSSKNLLAVEKDVPVINSRNRIKSTLTSSKTQTTLQKKKLNANTSTVIAPGTTNNGATHASLSIKKALDASIVSQSQHNMGTSSRARAKQRLEKALNQTAKSTINHEEQHRDAPSSNVKPSGRKASQRKQLQTDTVGPRRSQATFKSPSMRSTGVSKSRKEL